uniref:Uncharacterized protein n=1 Tax=Parascaris univalens TaxID=6257 RepID=A0A915C5W2_PARUN
MDQPSSSNGKLHTPLPMIHFVFLATVQILSVFEHILGHFQVRTSGALSEDDEAVEKIIRAIGAENASKSICWKNLSVDKAILSHCIGGRPTSIAGSATVMSTGSADADATADDHNAAAIDGSLNWDNFNFNAENLDAGMSVCFLSRKLDAIA